MRRLLAVLALVALAPAARAQAPYTCVLHVSAAGVTVDSCKAIVPPAPPPPPPPPAPAPVPPPPPPPPTAYCGRTDAVRVVKVSTAAALHAALAGAKPGDVIVMADGTYSGAGELRITTGGTAAQPISLCGSSKAIIDAGGLTSNAGINAVNANNWKFTGFTITDGLFGIYSTHGSGIAIRNVTIHAIGQEGVSLKLDSKHDTVSGSSFYDLGRKTAEWGEGIYVGTAYSQWPVAGVPDHSDSVVVDGNTFGPDVRAEHVDVKEGTWGCIIRNNTFNGAGMVKSESWGPASWVDLEGAGCEVYNNTGTTTITSGFRTEQDGPVTALSGHANIFHDNILDVKGAPYGFDFAPVPKTNGNVAKCSNVVKNASKAFNSSGVACTP